MTIHQDIKALQRRQREINREARTLYNSLKDDTPEDEARKIERDFNQKMLEYDNLTSQIDELRDQADDAGDARRPLGEDGEVRGDGGGFIDLNEAYALRSGQSVAEWTRRNRPSSGDELSPGRYLRALFTQNPKNEAERRALAAGTDAAGGYTVPEVTSARLIDLVRANSVLSQAGAQTVPLTTDETVFARLASDPVPAWRAENAAVAESDPTFGRVLLKPKSLAVMVKASLELLEDSINMETELPNILARALAVEVDRAGLVGSGSASEPTGIVNYSGLTSNAFGGGALTDYSPLIQARTALHTANERLTGFVMSPRDEGTFASLADGQGQPMRKPEAIASTPMLWTSNMPTDGGTGSDESQIIGGDWSQLMMGMRSTIRIAPLRERFADNLQFGFIAHVRVDFAAARESAFTVLDAITP